MNSDDQTIMEEFSITAESKKIFHFEGYRYERLSDAVNYAKKRKRPATKPRIQHEN
jgi:hypothetical protein